MKRRKVIRGMRKHRVWTQGVIRHGIASLEAHLEEQLNWRGDNEPEYEPVEPFALAARVRKLKKKRIKFVVIAGTRTIPLKKAKLLICNWWKRALKELGFKQKRVRIISGGARGVDMAAILLAKKLTGKKAIVVPAEWNKHGRVAGLMRNVSMAELMNGLFLIWNGKSPGSKHMLGITIARKKPVYEVEV